MRKRLGKTYRISFYDVNGKIIVTPRYDNIQLSFTVGRTCCQFSGIENNDGEGFLTSYKSGNNSQSLRWQRAWSSDGRHGFSFTNRVQLRHSECLSDNRSIYFFRHWGPWTENIVEQKTDSRYFRSYSEAIGSGTMWVRVSLPYLEPLLGFEAHRPPGAWPMKLPLTPGRMGCCQAMADQHRAKNLNGRYHESKVYYSRAPIFCAL